MGRLTIGHLTNPGPQGLIDLGGTAVAAPAALSLMGGAFIFRTADGKFSGASISNNTDNVADFSHRTDSIRWDSPTIAGFILSAAFGEAASVDRAPGGIVTYNPSARLPPDALAGAPPAAPALGGRSAFITTE